jgi:hypothetical protein
MTLEELEQSLPNGLHDAKICSFTRDLEKEILVLKVGVLVGLPDDPPELQWRYRDGVITFTGVRLFFVECPVASSAFSASGGVFFSIARGKPGTFSREIEDRLPSETDYYSLYVLDWESSIHLAATEIAFEWV